MIFSSFNTDDLTVSFFIVTNIIIPINANVPLIDIIINIIVQPYFLPINVQNGTTNILLMLNPININAIALALFSGLTILAANIEPIPKNEPCANEVIIRLVIMNP